MAQRQDFKESKQVVLLAPVELKGERPKLITTDEIKQLLAIADQTIYLHRGTMQDTIQFVNDPYLLNLQAFFATLPDTEQDRELTAQEIFLLKSFLFAPRKKFFDKLEIPIQSIIEKHQKAFTAIDLISMMPKPNFSQALLLAIVERFSNYDEIRELFELLYKSGMLTEDIVLPCIRYINNFFIYRGFFGYITKDMKDKINFHLLCQFAPQVDACVNHYNTRMMYGFEGRIIRMILLNLEYINELNEAQNFYYGIADNIGNRFLYMFDEPNHMVKIIKALSRLEQYEFYNINIDLMRLLFSNVRHIDKLVSARNTLLADLEDDYKKVKHDDKIEDAKKIPYLKQVNDCINVRYKFFESLAKRHPQYVDSLAHVFLVLSNRDLYNQENIDKIYAHLPLCDEVSAVFSKIQSNIKCNFLTKEVCTLVLEYIQFSKQLNAILFFLRPSHDCQLNVDFFKKLIKHISIWKQLIKKLNDTFEYDEFKGRYMVNNKQMLSYLDEIKYKLFLSGLDPKIGANSPVFHFFGQHGKGIPNHVLGDDKVLNKIESFLLDKPKGP